MGISFQEKNTNTYHSRRIHKKRNSNSSIKIINFSFKELCFLENYKESLFIKYRTELRRQDICIWWINVNGGRHHKALFYIDRTEMQLKGRDFSNETGNNKITLLLGYKNLYQCPYFALFRQSRQTIKTMPIFHREMYFRRLIYTL